MPPERSYSILSDLQLGFRKRLSFVTQLLLNLHDVTSMYDDMQVDMVILDFSKAFDTVSHQRLMIIRIINLYLMREILGKCHTYLSHGLQD